MSKIDEYDFKTQDPELEDFRDDITTKWNNGKYGAQQLVSTPTWSANNGEFSFFRDTNTRRFYFYINSSWDFIDLETPRIMINFSGTAAPAATINQHYGVDTLTRNSIGEYLVKFTNNLTNANMIASGMARDLSNNVLAIAPITGATSSLLLRFFDVAGNLRDPNPAMVVIHGN